MNAPVRASIRTSSLVAGAGQGWGVAVGGPQEGNPNDHGPPVVWYSIDGGRSGRMDTQSANTSLNETTSLVVEDRVVALEDPPVATWSADGQNWEPLPMTGASLADHAWLEIGRGDTIVAIAKFEPNAPAGLPNDQVDMLVYAGTLK